MEAAAIEAPVDSAPAGGEGAEPDVDSVIDDAAAAYDAEKSGEAPAEAAPEEPVEAKPSTEAKDEPQEAKAQETKEEEPVEPLFAEPETEDLKKAFKSLGKYHPTVAKALRNSFYENKAYKEVFTVPEARRFKELFPSVQEAEAAKSANADLLTVDQLLHESPQSLLNHIQQRDPQAFAGLTNAALEAVSNDPAFYSDRISKPAVQNYKDFYLKQAQATGDQELQAALEIIEDRESRLFGTQGRQQTATRQQADPATMARLRELEARNAQIEQQNAYNQEQAVESFKGAIDSQFENSVRSQVQGMLERAGADLSPAGIQEIQERVLAETYKGLQDDLALQRRLGWSVKQGRRDSNHQKELSDLLSANAKRFIPAATSKHLKWLTQEIVKSSANAVRKAEESAPAKVVRGATPGAATSSSKVISKADQANMSADEIMKKAAEGYDFA